MIDAGKLQFVKRREEETKQQYSAATRQEGALFPFGRQMSDFLPLLCSDGRPPSSATDKKRPTFRAAKDSFPPPLKINDPPFVRRDRAVSATKQTDTMTEACSSLLGLAS